MSMLVADVVRVLNLMRDMQIEPISVTYTPTAPSVLNVWMQHGDLARYAKRMSLVVTVNESKSGKFSERHYIARDGVGSRTKCVYQAWSRISDKDWETREVQDEQLEMDA